MASYIGRQLAVIIGCKLSGRADARVALGVQNHGTKGFAVSSQRRVELIPATVSMLIGRRKRCDTKGRKQRKKQSPHDLLIDREVSMACPFLFLSKLRSSRPSFILAGSARYRPAEKSFCLRCRKHVLSSLDGEYLANPVAQPRPRSCQTLQGQGGEGGPRKNANVSSCTLHLSLSETIAREEREHGLSYTRSRVAVSQRSPE